MRVVIGEDEALLRQGLELLLEGAGFEVVGSAGEAGELMRKVRAHRPALLVTDIRMPPKLRDDGLRVAIEVRRELPETAVLVLSQHASRRYSTELLATGAAGVGYLLKQRIADTDTFVGDLRRLAAGGTVLDPEIAAAMVSRFSRPTEPLADLTARQREVLAMMAEGRTNTGIAARLHVTEKAVTRHTSTIYQQLGISQHADDHRRVLAVIRYLTSRNVQGDPE